MSNLVSADRDVQVDVNGRHRVAVTEALLRFLKIGRAGFVLTILFLAPGLAHLGFAQQPIPFDRVDLLVPVQPLAVAVGDFNHDGKPDLAVLQAGTNTVSVLLGNGDRSFRAPRNMRVGSGAIAMAVADFDGDGNPDLVVVNRGSNSFSILLGNGDGSFQPQRAFPAGDAPVAVVVADFNRDRQPDLAVVNQGSSSVSLFLGSGDGSFQLAGILPVGRNPVAIAAGDFNRDGNLDLAVTDQGSTFVCDSADDPEPVESADESGFQQPARSRERREYSRDCMGSADGTPSVSVLLGNGDGTFQRASSVPLGVDASAIAVGRFRGAASDDLVVAHQASDTVSVLLGNGDGSFQPAQALAVGAGPVAVLVADMNGDGNDDVLVANRGSHTVSILLGNGDGSFRGARDFGVDIGPASFAVADFDRNGVRDLVTANQGSNNLSVLLGQRCPECWESPGDAASRQPPSAPTVAPPQPERRQGGERPDLGNRVERLLRNPSTEQF